ncbi:hypothetical protein DLE01_39260 [Streptomyces sp. FT05W]|nr:hypothetical protein DLE01_39260 [Streptomyces sp. FT05W]
MVLAMFPSMPDTRPAPPAPCGVPPFGPLRVRGGGGRRLCFIELARTHRRSRSAPTGRHRGRRGRKRC